MAEPDVVGTSAHLCIQDHSAERAVVRDCPVPQASLRFFSTSKTSGLTTFMGLPAA
jgi:hypothetical protein